MFGAGAVVVVCLCSRGRGSFRLELCVVGQAWRRRRMRVSWYGWVGCWWAHCGAAGGTRGCPVDCAQVAEDAGALACAGVRVWPIQYRGAICMALVHLWLFHPLVFEHGHAHCKRMLAPSSACRRCWCCRWSVAVRRCASRCRVGSSALVKCPWSRSRHGACMLCPLRRARLRRR